MARITKPKNRSTSFVSTAAVGNSFDFTEKNTLADVASSCEMKVEDLQPADAQDVTQIVLLKLAEKHDQAIANLERQWQAYLTRIAPV